MSVPDELLEVAVAAYDDLVDAYRAEDAPPGIDAAMAILEAASESGWVRAQGAGETVLADALRKIAYPDGDEAASYDWSVAEKIARRAFESQGRGDVE